MAQNLVAEVEGAKKMRPLGGVCPEVCLLVFKHLVELEDKLRLQQLFEMQPQQASLGLPSNHRCKGILQDSRYEKIAISTRFCEPACCVAVQTSYHTKETSVCAFMCAAWCTHLLKSVINGMPMPYASARVCRSGSICLLKKLPPAAEDCLGHLYAYVHMTNAFWIFSSDFVLGPRLIM